ncbi:MAG: hypothetical protein U9R54_04665 [Bacteroidota bacterium]|nr:hypothetical protein [Bacteroidota bacterium]
MKNNNIEIKEIKNSKTKKLNLILKNDLTIYSLETIKQDIINAFNKYDNINLKFRNVSNLDLSFIQFIKSIQKTAAKQNKKFSMDVKIPEEIQMLINNSGLEKILKYNTK